MRLKKLFSPHIPLALSLLASAGCVPPTPNYCAVREDHADYDKCRLDNNVDIPNHPLALQEIIDIAIARNLDIQVQMMEELAQCERVFAQKLRELPDLDLNGEFTNRNNDPAWFSRTVNPNLVNGKFVGPPGPISQTASQSTSPFQRSIDGALAISVIDFGLSFIRTRQEMNRLLLLKQRNMRARQNLVLDLFRAYYRAMVAKQAIGDSRELINILQERQQVLAEQVRRQLVSEMKGLVNENRLIDMQVKLYAFENEYRSAVTELSGLMGVPPGQHFELEDVEVQDIEIGQFNMRDMENVALRYRPELLAQDMQFNVDADEVRASIIQMFPNARLFAGLYHDDDQYMFNHDWYKFGVNLSWNILKLPSMWGQVDIAKVREKISWETRLSMSMGILTQVHLAYINVMESNQQYKLAKELFQVKNKQLRVARVLESSGEMSSDDVMVFDVEALFARVNAVKSYANLQIALEQLSNSLGRPLLLSGIPDPERPYGLEECCNFVGLAGIQIEGVKRVPSELMREAEGPHIVQAGILNYDRRSALLGERRRLEPGIPRFDVLTGKPYMGDENRRGSAFYKQYLAHLRKEDSEIAENLFDQEQDQRSQSFFYGEDPGEEGERIPTDENQIPLEEYDPSGEGPEVAISNGVLYYEDYLKSAHGSTQGVIQQMSADELAEKRNLHERHRERNTNTNRTRTANFRREPRINTQQPNVEVIQPLQNPPPPPQQQSQQGNTASMDRGDRERPNLYDKMVDPSQDRRFTERAYQNRGYRRVDNPPEDNPEYLYYDDYLRSRGQQNQPEPQ